MNNLIGYPESRLNDLFIEWEMEPYRVHQVFNWIYHYRVKDFASMSNLSKALRNLLAEHFVIALPRISKKTVSGDGAIKYLFELDDNSVVESVWMPSKDRRTLCVSTQVGCRLACAFCLTGKMGLKRNLTAAEILGQFLAINEDLAEPDRITNVVLMGMGEPLDNYEAVVDAVRLMVSPEALRLSNRKVTLSTAGQVDRIKRFQTENLHISLAISLNASDDETRDRIMPINKKYPIKTLLDCLKAYPLKPNRRFTFEYVLLEGINDSDEDARRLAKLLHGLRVKVNLIPFNGFSSSEYRPPSEERMLAFQDYLISKNYSVFIRRSRGSDILGACGQLAGDSLSCCGTT